jgi:hypothetical protein
MGESLMRTSEGINQEKPYAEFFSNQIKKTPDTMNLTLNDLGAAVTGRAAAFRCLRRLQPAGGEGDKVFPPTFVGGVYAIEQRRVPGREQPVTCVSRCRNTS